MNTRNSPLAGATKAIRRQSRELLVAFKEAGADSPQIREAIAQQFHRTRAKLITLALLNPNADTSDLLRLLGVLRQQAKTRKEIEELLRKD